LAEGKEGGVGRQKAGGNIMKLDTSITSIPEFGTKRTFDTCNIRFIESFIASGKPIAKVVLEDGDKLRSKYTMLHSVIRKLKAPCGITQRRQELYLFRKDFDSLGV
jgi:hypothetical protein